MATSTPKILIIRFSSIGDIVLTTPVIRCLQQQLGAEVHFLTKSSFAGVLKANPHLHKVWTIDKKVSEVLPQLRAEQFSAIVDLHNNLRSRRLRLGLLGIRAYTFDKLNWQKWLLTRWKVNHMPDVHIVDRYLSAAAPLGIVNDKKGLDHFIPAEDVVDTALLGISTPFIALVIGAAHATKRLPMEKLRELCVAIAAPVVLLGGPDDKATGQLIADGLEHVYNACGTLRLHQSADMLRQAAVVITHDTGLMHMAAALGKPIISIWGNTVPSFGMYPYLPEQQDLNTSFEVPSLSCRPCSKIGYASCPKGHFKCMELQDIQAIAHLAVKKTVR